ncbi:hypothetical protein IV203_000920 [Nitzschia inconspicua]|uniref:Uncharacterized protein n=1 Tax=Nitzschia inconspicua TaxID=303405 RepID=A0A9K3PT19_9STRA|nr:hypothetical protein IV203_000920 [Nitzschia inconspicua]
MTAVTSKAKSIDRYIAESPKQSAKGKFSSTAVSSIELWPEPAEGDNKYPTPQKEEDLYGYEDAAPTPRKTGTGTTPRRSSLKGSAGEDGRRAGRRASIGYTGEMTLVLPTGATKKKRSSISFADNNNVREVEPVASMVENPRTLWFQKAEYEHILEKVQDLVEHAKSEPVGGKQRPTWVCTRGLENAINSRYVEERAEATATVLDENRVQKYHKNYDDEYLRQMYRFHSADSQHRAEQMAKKDEKDVEDYLKVTRKMCRRMSC